MNDTGDNIVSYYTFRQKYLHDIYIRASDIDIGASQGQVFFRVNDINIGAYYIDIGALQAVFGPYKPTLLITLALLPERSG